MNNEKDKGKEVIVASTERVCTTTMGSSKPSARDEAINRATMGSRQEVSIRTGPGIGTGIGEQEVTERERVTTVGSSKSIAHDEAIKCATVGSCGEDANHEILGIYTGTCEREVKGKGKETEGFQNDKVREMGGKDGTKLLQKHMGNLGRREEPMEGGASKNLGDYLTRIVLGLPASLSLGGKKETVLDRENSKPLRVEKDGRSMGVGLFSGFETAGGEEVRVDFSGSDVDEESSHERHGNSFEMETSSGEEKEMMQE